MEGGRPRPVCYNPSRPEMKPPSDRPPAGRAAARRTPCPICERVSRLGRGRDPFLVREFEHSILAVGEHQFHRGYCVLLLKRHAREPHELPSRVRAGLFRELAEAARAVEAAFRPWKMNYACLGNVVPHIHWHLIPRYESDPDRLKHPWLREGEFARRRTTPAAARAVAARVRRRLGGAEAPARPRGHGPAGKGLAPR